MKIKIISILSIILFTTFNTNAQTNTKEDTDTLSNNRKTKIISHIQLVLPVSLIATGTWGICNGWLQSVNCSVQKDITNLRKGHFMHADDYIQYLPVVSNIGLEFIGAKAKHTLKERLIVTATSYLAMGIMVNGIKLTVNEKRPDSSASNSFPSGHTATAFMGAELVRGEYGTGYAVGAYSIAIGVAFLRLYNNRHWLNDVIAGAGVGILSARIGYWLLPMNQRLFHLKKKDAPIISACPFYDYQNKSWGGALSVRF